LCGNPILSASCSAFLDTPYLLSGGVSSLNVRSSLTAAFCATLFVGGKDDTSPAPTRAASPRRRGIRHRLPQHSCRSEEVDGISGAETGRNPQPDPLRQESRPGSRAWHQRSRRQTDFSRRVQGENSLVEFLGDLVRALPRGNSRPNRAAEKI